MATAPSWPDPTWLGPHWLERQGDPESSSFVPGTWIGPARPGPLPGAPVAVPTGNWTHRRATTVGSLWTAPRALVDERGLIVPLGRGWSLDWWVRAEDRWHHPSRARGVRQRLIGRAPVPETALRVPGGDVVHRVAGFLDGDGRPAVLIEIENGSAVPVALAIAVRPYDLLGHRPTTQVVVDDRGIDVDGRGAVRFTRAPADVVTGTAATGDPAAIVGQAPGRDGGGPIVVEDAAGWASAAVVFPLAHTATFRAVIPLDEPDVTVPTRRGRRRAAATAPAPVAGPASSPSSGPGADDAPTAEQVAKGWDVQLRRGLQITLPDQKLDDAFHAARAQLLLLAADGRLAVDRVDGGDGVGLAMAGAAEVVTALDEAGFADEAASVVRGWPARQAPDGELDPDRGRIGSTAAALGAVADHWRLTRDRALVDDLIAPLAKGAHWLAGRRTSRRAERDVGGDGLLPNDRGGPDLGGPGLYPRDSAMAARALRALAPAEDAAGQPEVAEDARALADALTGAVHAWLADGDGPLPLALGRSAGGTSSAALDVVAPVGVLAVDAERVAATVEHLRGRATAGGLVLRTIDRTGTDPGATLRLAQVAISTGDERAIGDLDAVVEAGGAMASWPTVIHPRTGGGSAGWLHDPAVTARFVRTVRQLLVRELPDDAGLALCSVVPERWWGQSLDVRDAPTAFGTCSFSIRWHGERPALLWELDRHADVGAVAITAPGFDPSWSSTEPRGEALLAAPVRPVAPDETELLPVVEGEVAVDLRLDLRADPRPDAPSGDAVPPPAPDGGDSFS